MTDDKTKDFEERKRKAEEELERYAQAGISSPGVVKAARWVSRGLYLAMGFVVVYLLWSQSSSVPVEDFERAVGSAKSFKKKYIEQATLHEQALTKLATTELEAGRDISEANSFRWGAVAARNAENNANLLIGNYRNDIAYAEVWRAKLALADGSSIKGDPVEWVIRSILEAASRPAGTRQGLVDRLANAGIKAVTEAALHCFTEYGPEEANVAVQVLSYLGYHQSVPDFIRFAEGAPLPLARRLAYAASLLTPAIPSQKDGQMYFLAESWVGYLMLTETADVSSLIMAYKASSEEHDFELLALIAQFAVKSKANSEFFREWVLQASEGEVIIAFNWMGKRMDDSSAGVLKTYSTGKGEVALAAKAALNRILAKNTEGDKTDG